MDYQRIYDAFIADRCVKQKSLKGYVERHHIQPRSLGGSDDNLNIVRLTATDHYFAHCCLAKIHGGAMWFALNAIVMLNQRNGNKFSQRRMIDAARRETSIIQRETTTRMWKEGRFQNSHKPGTTNGNHNPEVHQWVNLDSGETRAATIFAMHKEFGGNRPSWTQAVTGGKKTAYGWEVKGTSRIRGLKGKSFRAWHESGRQFEGTQAEFTRVAGCSCATACRLARGNQKEVMGWRLA